MAGAKAQMAVAVSIGRTAGPLLTPSRGLPISTGVAGTPDWGPAPQANREPCDVGGSAFVSLDLEDTHAHL